MIPIAPTSFWGPMTYAIIGGLADATLLTRVSLLALYVTWFRIKNPHRLLTRTRLSERPPWSFINFSREVTLAIDPTLLSPISALLGALVGGGASLLGVIYTQRSQDRLQRVASEIAKRETVYADFVMSASNLLIHAYTHEEIVLSGDVQRMIGLINRMRLFAPTDVVGGAEAVVRAIVDISLKPSIELRQLAREAWSKSLDPDPLLAFSSVCRADLDNVHRTVV